LRDQSSDLPADLFTLPCGSLTTTSTLASNIASAMPASARKSATLLDQVETEVRDLLSVRWRQRTDREKPCGPLDNHVAIQQPQFDRFCEELTAIQGLRGSRRQLVSPLTKGGGSGTTVKHPTQQTRRRGALPGTKEKLLGPKSPLPLSHAWSVRAKLQIERRGRCAAAILLRCGSMTAPNSHTVDRATIRHENRSAGPVRVDGTIRQSSICA
jgi:hypothetical protein